MKRIIRGFLIHTSNFLVYFFNRILNSIQISLGHTSLEPLDEVTIVFINLDRREDRLKNILGEFRRLRLVNYIRFSAIQNQNGAIGCSASHESVLRNYRGKGKYLMICEDDILFMHTRRKLNRLIADFEATEEAAIMCLGFNTVLPKAKITRRINRIKESQTTSCYIVKPGYIDILIENATESQFLLINNPDNPNFQLDQMWKKLQEHIIFVAPSRHGVIQKPSYSDIQLKNVRYGV